jgi:predicted amidohydrolase
MVVSIGVNERDGGTLYNTQLLFDADGTLIQRRRKITPTHFERMIWARATDLVCAPSTARSAALASWLASNTTTHWRAMR